MFAYGFRGSLHGLANRAGIERGYVVAIPKQIAERCDIEKGDEVWWTDDDDGDGPEFIQPSEL